MKTREYFPILLAVIVERTAFESRCHNNLRRRCRNEIDQRKPADAYNTKKDSQSFEQMPTIKPEHGCPPVWAPMTSALSLRRRISGHPARSTTSGSVSYTHLTLPTNREV